MSACLVDLVADDLTQVLEIELGEGHGLNTINVLDPEASYFRYSQHHKSALYNSLDGCPLRSVPLRRYLFECALPSYAKQFISKRWPSGIHRGSVWCPTNR